jgi:predicted dienelactone hydrolase
MLCLAAGACARPGLSNRSASGHAWRVGSLTRRYIPDAAYNWRGALTHALVTNVWFPVSASASMSNHTIGPPGRPLFRLGAWAEDVPPAAGRFPLIVLSHGTGGSALIMAWLARALASDGFVVAAVNHPGNNALEAYTAEGFLVWWERARDLTTVIDAVLRDDALRDIVDQRRIGAVGFSLGGYAVIEIAGGRSDPALFQAFCRSSAAQGCDSPPEFPDLFSRWTALAATNPAFQQATLESGRSYRDPRIRAVFAIAPALGPAFITESLMQITMPVAITAGESDPIVPVGPNARRLAEAIPGARLVLQPGGVGHYTFLAACTDAGRTVQPQLCNDSGGADREAVHRRTAQAAVAFFDETLRW